MLPFIAIELKLGKRIEPNEGFTEGILPKACQRDENGLLPGGQEETTRWGESQQKKYSNWHDKAVWSCAKMCCVTTILGGMQKQSPERLFVGLFTTHKNEKGK